MSFPRKKLREIIFISLFSKNFIDQDKEEHIAVLMKTLKTSKQNVEEALLLAARPLSAMAFPS